MTSSNEDVKLSVAVDNAYNDDNTHAGYCEEPNRQPSVLVLACDDTSQKYGASVGLLLLARRPSGPHSRC